MHVDCHKRLSGVNASSNCNLAAPRPTARSKCWNKGDVLALARSPAEGWVCKDWLLSFSWFAEACPHTNHNTIDTPAVLANSFQQLPLAELMCGHVEAFKKPESEGHVHSSSNYGFR